MTSLIEELQRDALDERVSVSTLLRKVRVAAIKLKLEETLEWVAHELDGYDSGPVPKYRDLSGTVKYNTGYHGWQLLLGDTSKLNRRDCHDPISQIEEFLKAPDSKAFGMPFNGAMNDLMQELTGGPPASYMLFIDKMQFATILSAVRDLVLDWALKLEQAGILGDGMTFSASEKRAAEQQSSSISIGSVGTFTGNLGVGNSIGTISGGDISVDAARSVVSQLRQNADALAAATADRSEFLVRLEQLEHHLATPKADPSFIKAALTDIRATLSGAAGNLLASGAVSLLNGVLGTGVPAV